MGNIKKNGVYTSGNTGPEWTPPKESEVRKEMAKRGKRYYWRQKVENWCINALFIALPVGVIILLVEVVIK